MLGFFNIKKMAANARSAQCILGKTASLTSSRLKFFATKSRTSSEGGYTCDFRRALATRQFQKNRITIASKKLLV